MRYEIQGNGSGKYRVICAFDCKLVKVLTGYDYNRKNILKEAIAIVGSKCDKFNKELLDKTYKELQND